MIVRISLVIAALALAAGSAHADAFRCGKTFVTFPALDNANKEYESISVRKSDILRVYGKSTVPPILILKPIESGLADQSVIAVVDQATHQRIIACLD